MAERQGDLKSLRGQIETLRRDMAAAEGSRKDVADQLQDAERAISSTQRELHSLTTQVGKLQATLRNLDGESRELEKGLRAQQGQLEKLLYRQYLRCNPDPLRLLGVLPASRTANTQKASGSAICRANGLPGKTGIGADAPQDYQRGRIGRVIDYCLGDVRSTLQMYRYIQTCGGITDPRTGEWMVVRIGE